MSVNLAHYTLGDMALEGGNGFPTVHATDIMDCLETWANDPLATKTVEIVQAVETSAHGPKVDGSGVFDHSSSPGVSCIDFFSPPQLRKFLDIYWKKWYPNWPTIHRPLFDPLRTPSILIAAMTIMGACHSTTSQDCADSKLWANVVEKLVFDELEQIKGGPCEVDRRNMIKLLQAACIMCIYQHWNGTNSSKKRIRRQRFVTLVSVSNYATN
ncbi:uncharacterized protein Z520_03136 [Fonsecaea multimorphosa CBS 102226]|uniref:Xylanolytic transcriptional activator regulatory domain-containing protein n=1 Tax=Fonsecaea multimorphosa CBS 102226 TaxID=1442371 RepID=A0A0D2KXN4_9EURO|nr:uncharacterized protein Z520_03136 [Fonsecaea multimorphosa CBS 102226]KIY01584.1 hypothetical protein Z520_03136 [Fonsecaea multimorphosa CBS 102226]